MTNYFVSRCFYLFGTNTGKVKVKGPSTVSEIVLKMNLEAILEEWPAMLENSVVLNIC